MNYGHAALGELVDMGVDAGFVEKSGSWFSYKDTRLGQGRDAAMKFFADNPAVEREVTGLILAKHGIGQPAKPGLETAAPEPSEPSAGTARPRAAKSDKTATTRAAA